MLTILALSAALFTQPTPEPKAVRTSPTHAGTFTGGAVAADHHLASAAGAQMLALDGNAVDAAVATSFALSVVRPFSCGIGGGGFMVIKFDRDPTHGNLATALNYREQAPAWTTPTALALRPERDKASVYGGRAVATPGTVAGLLYALERYGTLPRATVIEPAIRLAQEGFEADAAYAHAASEAAEWFGDSGKRRERFGRLWRDYLKEGKVGVGDRIRVPQQAEAFRLIAQQGAAGFYAGPVARAMIEATTSDTGGVGLAAEDLSAFRVREMTPLSCVFRGRTVLSMPPPSSGGIVVVQVLGVLERRADLVNGKPVSSPEFLHVFAEASKHSFADRARHLGDPDQSVLPIAELLAPAMLDRRAALIDPGRVLPIETYGWEPAQPAKPTRDGGTSHLSVIDAAGNAVACTETINLTFGSFLVAGEFGFPLNNQMDDFLTRPGTPNAFGLVQSERNLPAPGKRPLSSMSPTIVVQESGRVELAVGAAGGPKIISATLQCLLRAIHDQSTAEVAVNAGRAHHQWSPNHLLLEDDLLKVAIESELTRRGHTPKKSPSIGVSQMARVAPDGRGVEAACDPRKGGRPAGTDR